MAQCQLVSTCVNLRDDTVVSLQLTSHIIVLRVTLPASLTCLANHGVCIRDATLSRHLDCAR